VRRGPARASRVIRGAQNRRGPPAFGGGGGGADRGFCQHRGAHREHQREVNLPPGSHRHRVGSANNGGAVSHAAAAQRRGVCLHEAAPEVRHVALNPRRLPQISRARQPRPRTAIVRRNAYAAAAPRCGRGGRRAWNAGDGSPCSMRAAASAVTLRAARARRERRRRARGGGGGLLRLQRFRSWSMHASLSVQHVFVRGQCTQVCLCNCVQRRAVGRAVRRRGRGARDGGCPPQVREQVDCCGPHCRPAARWSDRVSQLE
jgi:hypothetical protein